MEDNRKSPRVVVHWRSAIVSEANGERVTTQGTTNDISSDGVSVICHRNISPGHVVTVYLLIHSGNEDHPELVFEAQGKVMNNVLSGKQGGFRLGILFTKFVGESKKMLEKYIPKSHGYGTAAPKPAAPPAKTAPAAKTPPAGDAPPAAEAVSSNGAAPTENVAPPADKAPATDSAPAENVAPEEPPPR